MHVSMFNRESVSRPKVKRDPALPGYEDLMGILDPGFEALGSPVEDFQVAPGVAAHFSTMANPPADYFSMPTLERR